MLDVLFYYFVDPKYVNETFLGANKHVHDDESVCFSAFEHKATKSNLLDGG